MTSPRDRWPDLFWFFDVMHQDYDVEFDDKEDCLREATGDASSNQLKSAIRQWHEAFDHANDERFAELVQTFNSWWDADKLFGGHRQWAEWVREHLEAELVRRG